MWWKEVEAYTTLPSEEEGLPPTCCSSALLRTCPTGAGRFWLLEKSATWSWEGRRLRGRHPGEKCFLTARRRGQLEVLVPPLQLHSLCRVRTCTRDSAVEVAALGLSSQPPCRATKQPFSPRQPPHRTASPPPQGADLLQQLLPAPCQCYGTNSQQSDTAVSGWGQENGFSPPDGGKVASKALWLQWLTVTLGLFSVVMMGSLACCNPLGGGVCKPLNQGSHDPQFEHHCSKQ